MRKLIATILICGSAGSTAAESFYALMKEGAGHYKSGDLQKAQETFANSMALATNETQQLNLAQYNLANTRHRLGNYQDATELYGHALNHEDGYVRSDAFYNRGLSLFEQSKATEEADQLDEAIMQVSTAMGMFEQSLELNAEGRDAKTNLELAYLRHEALLEKKKAQEEQEKKDEEKKDDKQENQDPENKDEQGDQEQQDQEKQDENKDPGQDPENQDNQDQEQPGEQDPSQDEQNQDQNGEEDPQGQAQPEEGQPGEEQRMTPEEADMLLDALREKEKANRARFRMRYGSPPNYPVENPY
jgi:tetratricopeptide (TPR) repeat protein